MREPVYEECKVYTTELNSVHHRTATHAPYVLYLDEATFLVREAGKSGEIIPNFHGTSHRHSNMEVPHFAAQLKY